ncbi:Protein OS-9 [Sporothrix eucalyptigena]|uniref:Endoplasmic reticulum lectin n=1 Tax=Sporothrix eucalyptigena TaxID=1812306 RepID=A0ABP0BJW4_9PEZI
MRSLDLILLAGLPLAAARQPGFSIHEDLLAHPQFEVVFSDSYILEKDAYQLLDDANRREASASYQSDSTTSETDVANPASESASAGGSAAGGSAGRGAPYGNPEDAADGSAQVSETFEIMNVPPSKYLCSVPVLAPPAPPNQTATELARAEEVRELTRMSDRGIEIISTLEGECMYYVSGWWSYSFCYGKEIVQFHALTTKTGKPVKDPQSQEYVLGRMQTLDGPAGAEKPATGGHKIKGDVDVQKPLGGGSTKSDKGQTDPYNTELQIKGDQRYMMQRLGAGTICDLTGRERTVEIQYHCNPGSTSDRISWIKEVTTCAYLMEIRTPRLCEEAAFLPPKPTRAHPISCRRIVRSEEEAEQWHKQKTIEAYAFMQGIKIEEEKQKDEGGVVVGGVLIGARKALGRGEDGQPPLKLEPPKHFGRDGAELVKGEPRVVKVLAKAASKASGGAVTILPTDELAELDIRLDMIQELVGKLTKIAGGKAWRLEAVENPGDPNLEIRAVLEPEEDKAAQTEKKVEEKVEEKKAEADTKAEEKGAGEVQDAPQKVIVTVEKVGKPTEVPNAANSGDEESEAGEGSEETFKKDEL